MAITVPDFHCVGLDAQTERDLKSVLYGLLLIRRENGYGTITLKVTPEAITDISVNHEIKPKYAFGKGMG